MQNLCVLNAKKKISPTSLDLKHSEGNTCSFEAVCENCHHVIGVSAVVETEITDEGKIMNASSRIQKSSIYHTPISEEEIASLKNNLTRAISFDQMFKN